MKFFIFIYLFLSACSFEKRGENSTSREVTKAEAFLNELLFENGGCFTLLGSKPITSLFIYKGDPKDCFIDNLSEGALESLSFDDCSTEENYLAWQAIMKKSELGNFFFVEVPARSDPFISFIIFANVTELKKVLEEKFDRITDLIKISDVNELLAQLRSGREDIWHLLLENHYLAGILYGYGEENARVFGDSKNFSDEYPERVSQENFPIPIFAKSEQDTTSQKYKVQRELIKKFFKNRPLIESTLSCLLNFSGEASEPLKKK
jgi:hypothetical protein